MPVVVRLAAGLARWVCGEACRQLVLVVLFLAFIVALPGVCRSLVLSYVNFQRSLQQRSSCYNMCCDSPSLSATGKLMIVLSSDVRGCSHVAENVSTFTYSKSGHCLAQSLYAVYVAEKYLRVFIGADSKYL